MPFIYHLLPLASPTGLRQVGLQSSLYTLPTDRLFSQGLSWLCGKKELIRLYFFAALCVLMQGVTLPDRLMPSGVEIDHTLARRNPTPTNTPALPPSIAQSPGGCSVFFALFLWRGIQIERPLNLFFFSSALALI